MAPLHMYIYIYVCVWVIMHKYYIYIYIYTFLYIHMYKNYGPAKYIKLAQPNGPFPTLLEACLRVDPVASELGAFGVGLALVAFVLVFEMRTS